MAINKVVLAKEQNSVIEYLYPKTSSDMVIYETTTVEAKLRSLDQNKVDKISGMGLSSNDFSNAYKTKLDSVDAGAKATTVDGSLSTTSTNPVENKVVTLRINNIDTNITSIMNRINTLETKTATGDADRSVGFATNAGNAEKVNGHTVLADVPANAKFTDTDTDTHYNSSLVISNESGSTYANTTNSTTYVHLIEKDTSGAIKSNTKYKLAGEGGLIVSSTSSGVVNIKPSIYSTNKLSKGVGANGMLESLLNSDKQTTENIYPVLVDADGYLVTVVPTYTLGIGGNGDKKINSTNGYTVIEFCDNLNYTVDSYNFSGENGIEVYTNGTNLRVKNNLKTNNNLTTAADNTTDRSNRTYPVVKDKNGYLAVNVPWENTTVEVPDQVSYGLIQDDTNGTITLKANEANKAVNMTTMVNKIITTLANDEAGTITDRDEILFNYARSGWSGLTSLSLGNFCTYLEDNLYMGAYKSAKVTVTNTTNSVTASSANNGNTKVTFAFRTDNAVFQNSDVKSSISINGKGGTEVIGKFTNEIVVRSYDLYNRYYQLFGDVDFMFRGLVKTGVVNHYDYYWHTLAPYLAMRHINNGHSSYYEKRKDIGCHTSARYWISIQQINTGTCALIPTDSEAANYPARQAAVLTIPYSGSLDSLSGDDADVSGGHLPYYISVGNLGLDIPITENFITSDVFKDTDGVCEGSVDIIQINDEKYLQILIVFIGTLYKLQAFNYEIGFYSTLGSNEIWNTASNITYLTGVGNKMIHTVTFDRNGYFD